MKRRTTRPSSSYEAANAVRPPVGHRGRCDAGVGRALRLMVLAPARALQRRVQNAPLRQSAARATGHPRANGQCSKGPSAVLRSRPSISRSGRPPASASSVRNDRYISCISEATTARTDPHQGNPMFATPRINTSPANTRFHVRLQVRVGVLRMPYVRPVVFTTNRSGARL